MVKNTKFFLILAASIGFLFLEWSFSIAEIYKWEDFSKPFEGITETICPGHTNQVEVFLPDILKSYESVLLIVKIEVDSSKPGRPYLIVNNFNQDPYRIKAYQDSPIAIKTNHLRTGMNRFSFHNDSNREHSCSYGSYVNELRFDIPNMGKIDISKTKEIVSAEINKSAPLPAIGIDPVVEPTLKTTSEKIENPEKQPIEKTDTSITKKIENAKISKLTSPPSSEIEPNEKEFAVGVARWAVVIGISNYKDTRIPSLRYSSRDAQAFYNWLVSPTGGQYAPSRVRLLKDKQATGNRIKQSLFEWLGQVLEEDIVIIFFAGHGSPQSPDKPGNLFLLPFDVEYGSVATTGFPMWDIETAFKRFIKSKKVVVIADACHSGGVGQSFDIGRRAGGGSDVVPISSSLQALSKVGDGICILSASDDNQYSQESQKWGGGHGVFTYYLLKGIEGDADYSKDNRVSLGEIIPYLSEQVRRATRNAQTPTVAGKFDPALTIGK